MYVHRYHAWSWDRANNRTSNVPWRTETTTHGEDNDDDDDDGGISINITARSLPRKTRSHVRWKECLELLYTWPKGLVAPSWIGDGDAHCGVREVYEIGPMGVAVFLWLLLETCLLPADGGCGWEISGRSWVIQRTYKLLGTFICLRPLMRFFIL